MGSLAERVRQRRQDAPPAPPTGYGPPSPFDYPGLWLQVAGAILSVVSLVGYGILLLALRGPGLVERFVRIDPIPDGLLIVPDLFLLGGTFVLVVVGVPVVHELVHGTVYRLLGYEVSYGVVPAVGGFYVAAFGQFQTRRANLLVALAPLALPYTTRTARDGQRWASRAGNRLSRSRAEHRGSCR